MTSGQLRKHAVFLYGETGWQSRLAERLKVDGSTVRRWISGAIPIPGPVEVAVECMVRIKTLDVQNARA